jgi:hypothetical protein
LYISAEQPSHSIRKQNGEVFGIVAGPSFKPGDTKEERKSFEEIERWLIEQFDAGPIAYRWVNEDYSSTDCAPLALAVARNQSRNRSTRSAAARRRS